MEVAMLGVQQQDERERLFIGIDPGLYGAIGVVSERGALVAVHDIPTLLKGSGAVKQEVNAAGVRAVLTAYVEQCALVVIERVGGMPGQGAAGTFSLGDSVGCLRGVAVALGLPLEHLSPQKWKKHYQLSSDKEASRALAIRMWPSAELHLKKHADRAEALLIARYAILLWRTANGVPSL